MLALVIAAFPTLLAGQHLLEPLGSGGGRTMRRDFFYMAKISSG
jgi:hypothetical protein